MIKSQLFQLIKTLSKQDIRAIRKFLQSPYFNQREDVIDLFNILVLKKEENPDRLAVFQQVYPLQEFEEQTLRYVMSYLMKHIKQYFVISAIQEDHFLMEIQLLQTLKQRGLEQLFEKEWTKAAKRIDQQKWRNATYFSQKHQLHWEHLEFMLMSRRSGDFPIQALSDELTTAYVANLLWLACTTLIYQALGEEKLELKLLKDVLKFIEQGNFQNVPVVMIFYYSYKALSQPEQEVYFQQFKSILQAHSTEFPQSEATDIYKLGINFCIRRFNGGVEAYAKEALDLYKSGLDNGVFLQDGRLSRFTYNNITQLALRLKEWDWTRQFLEDYKKVLHPKERENTYLYNLAIYYYRRQKYDAVLELLQKTKFQDSLYNLDVRRMMLRIYYEQEAFDALESLLDSFKIYIHRLKIIGYHKMIYLNLIRFTKKLLYLNQEDKSAVEKLKKEVENADVVAEREWLLEQLNQ